MEDIKKEFKNHVEDVLTDTYLEGVTKGLDIGINACVDAMREVITDSTIISKILPRITELSKIQIKKIGETQP